MWEDTKKSANTAINSEDANEYCETLNLGNYDDWKIPTYEQLELLYKVKEKLYNGYGVKFYWSNNRFQDKAKIWDYAYGKDFTKGKKQKSIIEFKKARIRCVRDINITKEKEEL